MAKLATLCSTRVLTGGEALFYENDEAPSFYIIETGTIAIRKSAASGDEDVAKMGTGNHFGEMGLLGEAQRRSATAEAVEPTTVVEIPIRAFEDLINEHQNAGLHFYRNLAVTLAGRIRRTTEDLTGIRSLRLRHT